MIGHAAAAGWGEAPAGYDAASPYLTSLLAPETANRIRIALSRHLDTHAGRMATLAAAVRILRFADGENASPLPIAYGDTPQAAADRLQADRST